MNEANERRLANRRDSDVAENIRKFVHEEFKEHEERERKHFSELIEQLKQEAFVDTPAQHRQAHQAMIDASRAEENFWRELKGDIAKKSIWGVLQVLFTLIAIGMAAKFGLSTMGPK